MQSILILWVLYFVEESNPEEGRSSRQDVFCKNEFL